MPDIFRRAQADPRIAAVAVSQKGALIIVIDQEVVGPVAVPAHCKVEDVQRNFVSTINPHLRLDVLFVLRHRGGENFVNACAARVIGIDLRQGFRQQQSHAGVIRADQLITTDFISEELHQRPEQIGSGGLDIQQSAP